MVQSRKVVSIPQHKIKTSVPQLDPMRRFPSMFEDMGDAIKILFEHDLEHYEVFFSSKEVYYGSCMGY